MLRALVFALALIIAAPALAQSTTALRSTIDSVSPDGATLSVHSRTGEAATVRLKPDARVIALVPATLADVKEGAYIGVAAVPDGEAGLKALEVHIFPASMHGVGEGHRPFDLAPKSTMTNGDVSVRVEGADGSKITVAYHGGSKDIRIEPTTPIVAFTPGDRAELKPGAAIIARGVKDADGVVEAAFVVVGRNGLVPPM